MNGMSKIEAAIRKAIETGGKSRYALWKETGIVQSHLSKFMAGNAGLSFDNMELLANALGLEIVVRPKAKKRGSA